MWGWRSGRTIAVGVAVAAFALFCVLPLAYMIAVWLSELLREAASYRELLLDSRQRGLLLNTVVLGIGTALAATLVGVPLGIALARMALPFKPALRILLAAPAVLPTYVVGLTWLYLGDGTWMRSSLDCGIAPGCLAQSTRPMACSCSCTSRGSCRWRRPWHWPRVFGTFLRPRRKRRL